MENFDRDDAFFASVNRNKEVVEQVGAISAAVLRDFDEFYRRTASANAAVARERERKKKIERIKNIKIIAVVTAIIAVLSAGIVINHVYGDDIHTAIVNREDLNDALRIIRKNQHLVFNARGLANGHILNENSIEQYKDLNITSIEAVYVYMFDSYFMSSDNFDKEMEKLIKSVSYYSKDGEIRFYSNFKQFLSINGFSNVEEFRKAAIENILKKYRNGKIVPYENDVIWSWGISGRKGK